MRRYDWIAVMLRQIYRGLLLTAASAAILMLCGCSPSGEKQREMRSFVERYAREWQLGETEKIFQDFDPTFKKIYPTLADCIRWKKSIDDQWGNLKGIEVVKINQLAFIRQPYLVETKMTYEKGGTPGRFTIIFRDNTPRIARVAMADAPKFNSLR